MQFPFTFDLHFMMSKISFILQNKLQMHKSIAYSMKFQHPDSDLSKLITVSKNLHKQQRTDESD